MATSIEASDTTAGPVIPTAIAESPTMMRVWAAKRLRRRTRLSSTRFRQTRNWWSADGREERGSGIVRVVCRSSDHVTTASCPPHAFKDRSNVAWYTSAADAVSSMPRRLSAVHSRSNSSYEAVALLKRAASRAFSSAQSRA